MYRLFLLFCCTYIFRAATPVEGLRHARIIGGKSTQIEDAPYQVSIIMAIGGIPIMHTCGGSIISKNYVLTAGHCVLNGPDSYVVKSGTTSWAMGGKRHTVVDIIKHESFTELKPGEAIHDIALLKVTPEFELDGKTEKIVDLADKDDEVKVGDDALVTGWGYDSENQVSTTLNGLNVTIMGLEGCNEFYKPRKVADFYICAKHPSGEKDFCDGDSGGPLEVKGKQVGIVSFSAAGCKIDGRPGLYVDVAKHRDWIDEHIKAQSH